MFTWGIRPALLPGERLLRTKYVWAASGKSLPNYRLFVSLPPVIDARLYITDRRVIFSANLFFYIVSGHLSQWYLQSPSPDEDTLTAVTSAYMRLAGDYLQLDSRTENKQRFRTRELRTRIFTGDAGELKRMIDNAIAEHAERGSSAGDT